MATISSQSTRSSGRAQNYAKKDSVAISAVNASVPMFEKRLAQIRAAHGKNGLRPRAVLDDDGRPMRDADGNPVVQKDGKGRTVYEARYVEAYSLVESFSHDELDPDDPASWTRANELGRAVAEDRFPGHPVLVATEVNGRSGCVHNHIIVGAVHPETGRSIDSNVVTHTRLAVAHDRVLAEQGFKQRADMREKAQAAEQAMATARSAVLADPNNESLSPSQLQRKVTAAENNVHLERATATTASQAREERRLREFDRYRLNEWDRMIARDIGAVSPKEKFSEIELESRVRDALSDPRFRTWDELSDVAREHRVTITARGEDVSFGMMLAQSDGTLAEPARAHIRRGGRPGSGKGLGDGFHREDVEAAVERNVREQSQQVAQERAAATHYSPVANQEQFNGAQQAPLQAELDADTAPPVVGTPAPAFRSRLRDGRSARASETMLRRLDGLAALEEDYRDRGFQPDPEFVERIRESGGVGRKTLDKISPRLEPGMREQVELYVDKVELKDASYKAEHNLSDEIEAERREHPYGRPVCQHDRKASLRHQRNFHRDRHQRLSQELDDGVLEKDTSGARAEKSPVQRELAATQAEVQDMNQDLKARHRDQSHGMEM